MADGLELDKQVCFALYRASRVMTQMYRPALERLGLTYPQYLVMLVLWERGQVTVKELGHALDLDSGTLSPLLKRLEAAGLTRRTRVVKDERSVEVHLTERGAQLREEARQIPRQVACATDLDLAELNTLREALNKLADTVSNRQLTAEQP